MHVSSMFLIWTGMEYFTNVTTDSLWMVVRCKLGIADWESRRWHILIVDESKKKGSETMQKEECCETIVNVGFLIFPTKNKIT